MKIHEYQAKRILKHHGIPVPSGDVADNKKTALEISEKIGFPLAIKAQVHAGGRGKAGAIKIVGSEKKFKDILPKILGMSVKGLKVKKVLIEKAFMLDRQFYLAITIDRLKQCNVIIASPEGGVDIEEVAATRPDRIMRLSLKNNRALEEHQVKELATFLNLENSLKTQFASVLKSLYSAYIENDAQLAEINPLASTSGNKLIACDAKIILDDNALFRHKNNEALKEDAEDNELEGEAHKLKLAYVKLSGDIGIIGNGAGLVMTTMDEVKRVGGEPANFLDIGGGAKEQVMKNALKIIYMDKEVKGVFINIFGGITRCDEVAKGIIEAMKNVTKPMPTVLRLAGTKCEEASKLLSKTDFITADTMEEGARRIVKLVKGK